jgi:hypothetical protein
MLLAPKRDEPFHARGWFGKVRSVELKVRLEGLEPPTF